MPDRHRQESMRTEDNGDSAAVILLHGRGATADSILQLGEELASDAFLIAPQAHRNTWYPHGFMEPRDDNQPWLDAALDRVSDAFEVAAEEGFTREDVHLIGFSQGACLATEYAASNADRYGSVSGLSGGLIGQDIDQERYQDSMDGTPVFLGCSDQDPHIPVERVEATAQVFKNLGADVDTRLYEGMGHTVNSDEKDAIQALLS